MVNLEKFRPGKTIGKMVVEQPHLSCERVESRRLVIILVERRLTVTRFKKSAVNIEPENTLRAVSARRGNLPAYAVWADKLPQQADYKSAETFRL